MARAPITWPGIVLAIALVAAVILDARQPPSITAFITTYAEGRYDEAVGQAAAVRDLGPMRRQFVQDVQAWIAAEPGLVAQRRAAAAAFLLELTHARLETDWGRLSDLIEFTCAGLRTAGPPSPFELAWHRASIALASRGRARLWLLGEYPTLPHQRGRPPTRHDPHPRHLVHALDRFPGDPTLRLAQVLAWMWGRDQEPVRNVRRRSADSGPADALEGRRPLSLANLPQREALVALQPLVDDPVVGAEALVRIAHVHFTVGQHPAALQALQRAQQREAGTAIRYLSFFSAGRVFEALGQPEDAIAHYTKALDVVPNAESATIAVASLQFVHDEREAAVTRLGQVFDHPVPAPDPGRLTGYGNFIHWPQLRQALRAELLR